MTPEAVLTGHVEPVVCVSVSASQALVISGAKREFLSLPLSSRFILLYEVHV